MERDKENFVKRLTGITKEEQEIIYEKTAKKYNKTVAQIKEEMKSNSTLKQEVGEAFGEMVTFNRYCVYPEFYFKRQLKFEAAAREFKRKKQEKLDEKERRGKREKQLNSMRGELGQSISEAQQQIANKTFKEDRQMTEEMKDREVEKEEEELMNFLEESDEEIDIPLDQEEIEKLNEQQKKDQEEIKKEAEEAKKGTQSQDEFMEKLNKKKEKIERDAKRRRIKKYQDFEESRFRTVEYVEKKEGYKGSSKLLGIDKPLNMMSRLKEGT